jgi:hypothetical protein
MLDVEIIDVCRGIRLKEDVFLEQAEGQALEVMIEPLHIDFTRSFILIRHLPIEHIPSIKHLLFLHTFIITPDP